MSYHQAQEGLRNGYFNYQYRTEQRHE